jgi:hypothetical protein
MLRSKVFRLLLLVLSAKQSELPEHLLWLAYQHH